ncbi:hypothetical protein ACFFX0_27020 [Citricoccus parietis]|uniref:Uncharacterized protein n=1 Tax=Citricoccus parietis TaxID=592307 RepID=A0ABV5G6R9_9MICC
MHLHHGVGSTLHGECAPQGGRVEHRGQVRHTGVDLREPLG